MTKKNQKELRDFATSASGMFHNIYNQSPRGKIPEFSMEDHKAWYCPRHKTVLYNEGDLDAHQGSVDTDSDDARMRVVFVDVDTGNVFGVFETMKGLKANPADFVGKLLNFREAYLLT